MDRHIRSSLFSRVETEGFARKLGLEILEVEDGYAVVEMLPGPEDTNIFGMIHGGLIFSVLDEAFQLSCNSHGTIAVALSVNVAYHNPAREGVRLRAVSKEVHRSNRIATYDIRLTDTNQLLIATCQAVAYRKREALPFLDEKPEP